MSATTPPVWSLRQAVQPGIVAVRRHWPALALIQVGAVALVLTYYRSPALQNLSQAAAATKLRYGIWFAFAIGMVAGGALPETAKFLTGGLKRFDRDWLAESTYNALVYGVVGAQVDLFYRFQTYVFGSQHDVTTLAIKTLVDMALFSTIISIPTATALFSLRRERFQVREVFRGGIRHFYTWQVMPGLIPCWCFWIPVLFCTYAMPADLQLCFAMLAEAAWSIVFVFISKQAYALPA